jgi:hypothetical protein
MAAYGTRMTGEEAAKMAEFLASGDLQRNTSFDPNDGVLSAP